MSQRPKAMRENASIDDLKVREGDKPLLAGQIILSDQLAHIDDVLTHLVELETEALQVIRAREPYTGPERETVTIVHPGTKPNPLPPPPGKADPTRNEQYLVNAVLNAYVRGLQGYSAKQSAIAAGRRTLRHMGFETKEADGSYILTSSPPAKESP